MRKVLFNLVGSISLVFLCFNSSYAQRTMADMLRPVFDSSQLVLAVIDTVLANTGQNTPMPPQHSNSNQQISYNLDINKVVGEIPYNLTTSTTGQVNLTIPIDAFSSEYETCPQISLRYSSQSGISNMGTGWCISGISAIAPVNKSFFTDGNSTGKDRLFGPWALDGNRLVLQDENDTLQVFLTQSENIKVVHHTAGNGDFIAYSPDGSICRYDIPSNFYRYWYLGSRESLDGQIITYDYYDEGNLKLVKEINYGEGRVLHFVYNNASSSRSTYDAGVQSICQKKLSRIEVIYNDSVLRQYVMTYRDNLIEAPLVQLDMIGADGSYVNPLQFHYHGDNSVNNIQSQTDRLLSVSFNFSDPEAYIAFRGKLDYATEEDAAIIYPNKYNYYIHNYHQIRNKYNGNEEIAVNWGLNNSIANPWGKITVGEGFVDAFCMDVDGAHGEELVKVNQVTTSNNLDHVSFDIYQVGAGGLVRVKTVHRFLDALKRSSHYSVWPSYFLKGDFTGDGREEVIMCRTANPLNGGENATFMMLDLDQEITKCSGVFDAFQVYIPGEQYTESEIIERGKNSDRLFTADLDGDGKLEMCVLNDYGLDIYRFSFNSSGNVYYNKIRRTDLYLNNAHDDNLTIGDANGDGLTDIILLPNVPMRNVRAYLSKGNYVMDSHTINVMSDEKTNLMCLDYNLDGASDIIKYYKKDHIAVSTPELYYGFNTIVFTMKECSVTQQYLIPRTEPSILVPVSLYGQSSNICMVSIKTGNLYDIHRCGNPKNMDALMTAMADSRGRVSQMEYRQLYQSEYYQPGFNMTFPYTVYAGGMFVCSALATTVGSFTERDLSFNYHNATIHKQGLGFCGFQGIATYDQIRNESTYQIFDPTHFGVPVSVVSEQETHGYGYQTTVANDKRIQILLKNDTVTNLATGVTAITAYTHDTYGNVLTVSTSLPGNITKTITNEYSNVITDGNWLIGLERRHTESVTRGDLTLIEGRTTTYNGSWLPDTTITWCGNEQTPVLTRMIRYDNKRPDRVKTKAYMGTTLIKHIGYSADSHLPQYVSDERGMRVSYAYGGFGVTQSSLTPEIGMWFDDDELPDTPIVGPFTPLGGGNEINGGGQIIDPEPVYPILDSYYHYDSFGRQDSITAPDGSVKAVSLAWASDVSGALYMREQTESNKPTIRTWFDALGRKVREGTQRANDTWTYVLYEYDTLGRLARESMPTITGNASSWTSYTYEDTFDRLIEKEYPDGHSDTYAYNGLTTTSVVDGVTTTRTVDALGYLVSVTDAGGTLQYDLRPDGQPREIRAPGNIATTFTYDQYGRRITITDPSAGTRTTTYDANGHVSSESDANQKTVTSTYNSKGLLTSRTFGNDLTVTYSYNIWNNPTQMLGNDGHSKSWGYNDLQQLTSETTDGFKKTYAYDHNKVTSVAYSKDNGYICSENYTHMNGHLTSITLNTGDTIWALDKQNSRMLPTKVRLGKLNQSLSYDVYGHVTSREVTDREDEDLQYLQYYYNLLTGNMTLRLDHVNSTDETFSYDALNRLTGILPCNSSSCMLSQSTSYDGKGNITSHHTSGQYSYGFNNGNGVSQPYSFSVLSAPSPLIPQREQHISFNAMQLPDTIREGCYIAIFGYFGDMSRASMTVTDTITHNVETRTYYDQQYNEFTKTAGNATQSKRILWLGGSPYNAPAALVKRYGEQNWTLVHVLRDNLGSITHVVDTTGMVMQEMGYSAWGMLRDVESLDPYSPDSQPELLLGRGYTGHEHLPWFGLVNMNARLYDPAVGRFLSPDPLVQVPDNTQNYNCYSYCLNNPLRYIDQDGKVFILVPFLVGAALGATISGATYAITSAASGRWNTKYFGLSVAMGAISGVISTGVGMAGAALANIFPSASKFGMTLAFNFISQSASYAATNVIAGYSFNYYDIIAIAGSALMASVMPAFKPTYGNGFKNALAEIGFNSWKRAATGFMQGGIRSAFDGNTEHMKEGMLGGMASGIASSLAMDIIFGVPVLPNNRPGEIGTYRQGGIASYIMGDRAITLGFSMNLGDQVSYNTLRHEYAHVLQQLYMGWANFYATILNEYLKYGFYESYETPGTLEYNARQYEFGKYSF